MTEAGSDHQMPPQYRMAYKNGLYFLVFSLIVLWFSSGLLTNRGYEASEQSTHLTSTAHQPQCQEINKAKDKCTFYKEYCGDEDEGLLSYLHLYYCRLDHAHPAAMLLIILWLVLLLTSIGITAGDFFSINLSSIASGLRMSDTFAGVTFLALGNGSPDLFSTFSAMSSNSSMMAVGELVGAAAFITTVVAGSMAFVKPFKIERGPFLRDVVFLLTAVSLLLFVLIDGKLHLWECVVMMALYVFYVLFVVGYHWWLGWRQKRKKTDAASPEIEHTDNMDNERQPLLQQDGHDNQQDDDENDDNDETEFMDTAETYAAMRGHDPKSLTFIRRNSLHNPKPTFLQALEFRWKRTVEKSKSLIADAIDSSEGSQHDLGSHAVSDGYSETDSQPWYVRLRHGIYHMSRTLFPTLKKFRDKPIWHWAFNIFTAPTVLLLKITVPVVDRNDNQNVPHASGHKASKKWDRWLMILQGFISPQFVLAIVWLKGAGDMNNPRGTLLFPSLYCLAGSTVLAILILISSNQVREPQWYAFMSIAGFIVSAVWISTIADEVVGILQALGVILGISETILGFTVFAVGNSLDDLMADVTVAQHGHPVMALSACYGGPMLNILLGIGVSGLYVIVRDAKGSGQLTPLPLPADYTMFISIGTLMVSLICLSTFLMWRGWKMTKWLGVILICVWIGCTVVNLVVTLT